MDDTFDADTPVPSIESAESVTSDKMDSNHELGTIRNANEATPLTQLLAMNCDTIQESSLFTPAPSASVAPAASIAPSTSTASISSSRSDRSTKKARLKTLKKHHPSVKLIIDHTAHHYRASITRPDPPPLPEWLNLRETAQQLARLPQTNSKAYKLPLRRATREAASLMKAWRSSHPTWREAYRANGKMPWLPTRSELFAIEILEEKGRGMPRCITKLFEENEVELGWVFDHGYVEPGEPTGEGWEGVADFWKGAKVCDEAWRLAYMKDPKGKVSSLEFEDDLTALVREVVCRGSGRGVTEEASVVSEESQESGEGMVVKNEVGGAEDIEGEQREEELQERLHEEQLHRAREEKAREEKLQERRRQNTKRKREKRQEEKLQREKLQREKPQEEKRQEEMREKQGSQNEQNGETQNDHRNTSVTHQQTSPAPEQSLNTTISAPILKRIMIETVKEAMRDFGLDNLGKRQRQEDREDDDDDVPALTARKKQKITDHDNTAKQTDLPSPPPGSETPPAKVHESVEGYGNNKIEGKITEEMFIDLANKHNAGKTTNELKETTKELKETTNRCAVMEERQKATEKENKILRNQLTACFQRLELVEKGYYLQSPQPAQGSPARVQDQPTLQAQGRQSANVEQQQQQQNGGRSRGSSFYVGPTYSRPSI
ncbi:hypothetical protein QBC41DRAFT_398836 [Cercophora samala]|uniref:Uncharacterized protein n=1 Tax=Cercophora samala TaxID=330535 RepID=A0AA39Z8J2_9PEZI|nr:hypothetical protein QBC41DRAFT_398836 [Cercophora samala]